MNCPSRTDGVTLEHPTWNQNPPFLAPDLTTCEDLNGKANARERRDGDGGGGGPGSGNSGDDRVDKDYLTRPHLMPDGLPPQPSGLWNHGFHPRSKDVPGGEDQPRPSPPVLLQAARSSSAWGWISWTASVLVCSTVLSSLRAPGLLPYLFSSDASQPPQCVASAPATSDEVSAVAVAPSSPLHQFAKRETCGSGAVSSADYDLSMHVGALFIMLAISFLSCAFPIAAKKVSFVRIPASFFFAVRHFGTGVLLATAFVHLLPEAFILLGDDCLSSFWVDDYDAMPGAIALAAVFCVAVIEMIFQPARYIQPSPIDATTGHGAAAAGAPAMAERRRQGAAASDVNDGDNSSMDDEHVGGGGAAAAAGSAEGRVPMEAGPLHGTSHSLGRTLSRMGRDSEIVASNGNDESAAGPGATSNLKSRADEESVPVSFHGCGSRSGSGAAGFGPTHAALTPAQKHQKDVLQCMMLEVGILFHSVFIGMTLAVSVGPNFVVLLVAIAFHQFFEGLALGSRIAEIAWHPRAAQPWLMALAFGCTTPIGQAIGIATHNLYDPDSESGLILIGTMNAISAGLLVFASLVELLSEDFLSDESWRVLRGKKRVVACVLVFAGAFGMSVVGAWA